MKSMLLLLAFFLTAICNAQTVSIPDANLKSKLLAASPTNTTAKDLSGNYFKIDANDDGEIQITEAQQVSYIDVFWSNVNSLQGISAFTNLELLNCAWNAIPTIDVSGMSNLQTLWAWKCYTTTFNLNGCSNLKDVVCSQNSMTSIDFSNLANLERIICSERYNVTYPLAVNLGGCTSLKHLEISNNSLENLNLSGLSNLQTLILVNNDLTFLNVLDLTNLKKLDCRGNQLTALNVSTLINLEELIFYNNNLSSIDVSNLTNLTYFWGSDNQLTFLDVTNCTNLQFLSCSSNQLTTLLMKNGINETSNYISDNPNLTYICCDEFEMAELQLIANENCQVNTYCSFVPGGNYYSIVGSAKVDYDSNGCDVMDYYYPNLKFRITGNSVNTFVIPDSSGNYNIPLQAGTYDITPVLENPNYFSVIPSSSTVTFPSQSSPFTQNFCISPNGVHSDLEITILPTDDAIPGFDASYKLLYKNKGNQTQSGSINVSFNDVVLDFVSSDSPIFAQTNGNITWNFTNLLPFQSREINVVFNLNSPMENPALNSGDVLNYTASIIGSTDETPDDNTGILNQTVVNSYDPNDKTCLEGTVITPNMVGKYVHYLIRFENNGTANARNVVVTDMIDNTKFEINTLVPIASSHNFETKISNNNKVEFIFQSINLPFDDANNDGYVLFKIKTKPNLSVGSNFSNFANIYFDYNFPIITNNYITTVQNNLHLVKNSTIHNIVMHPNPVNDFLTFQSDEPVIKAEIYDISGRILSSKSVSENKIDVSELKSGNYIVKIYTENNIVSAKISKL